MRSRRVIASWVATLALMVMTNSAPVMSGGVARQADCDKQFADLFEDSNEHRTADGRLNRWKALAPKCGGTSIYQLRLGGLYVAAGQLHKAKNAFTLGQEKAGNDKELRLGIADVEFRSGNLEASMAIARQLIVAYPNWPSGYSAVAQIQLVRHNFDDAISNLEHATSLGPTSGAFQLLAMAYFQQQRPRESALAMQRALKLDRGALRNTQAVCATANSLVQLGHVAEADELLKKHLALRPEVATNSTFMESQDVVRRHQPKG
jgi:tetratricopeptide (TPR) repeat protein